MRAQMAPALRNGALGRYDGTARDLNSDRAADRARPPGNTVRGRRLPNVRARLVPTVERVLRYQRAVRSRSRPPRLLCKPCGSFRRSTPPRDAPRST
jgi:hypothetical protein